MRTILVLVCSACFASFGWAMLRHFSRTGKTKRGMALTAAVVPVFAALHLLALVTRPLMLPLFALILYLTAGALFWVAIVVTRGRGLAACFQRSVPLAIVRSGPYRLIRHPFYTAYTTAWIAGFAATGWWPLGLSVGFLAALYACAARREEQDFLQSLLRNDYLAYMRTTGRFLPRIGRINNAPLRCRRPTF